MIFLKKSFLVVKSRRGFGLIEIILASTLLAILITLFISATLFGEESTLYAGERGRAIALAEEGLEVVRNMRDDGFGNLTDGLHGLATSSNRWIFSGTSTTIDIFKRQISIGTISPKVKQVTSTVSWQLSGGRAGTTTLSTHFTNWRIEKGGVLVYGDGSTNNDAIRYRILDPATATWSPVLTAADVDAGSTNRALRAVQIYASATRNEKIMISRHVNTAPNPDQHYIYAQVFNGTTTTWGNVVLLSNWGANTFSDVQNYSGTYLANGDFMVVYSDNTTIPKFRIWNGTSWSPSSISTQSVGGVPTYIIARERPGTNQVMVAVFDNQSDTNTEYFRGGAYIQGNWVGVTEHALAAPLTTKRFVDFTWSPNNPVKGGLVYSDSGSDVAMNIRICTASGADGSGTCSWSATANTTIQTNRLGAMDIEGRLGANEFIACDKDANNNPRIICYRADFSGANPVWSDPVNQILVAGTDGGIQRSYDVVFETAGEIAIAVYSDTTAAAKLKKYTASTNTWDQDPTSLPMVNRTVERARVMAHPDADDVMILIGNTQQDFFSVVWDGYTDTLYTVPLGKIFTTQGTNGSADLDFWFDFAWDRL